jgi:hypothetical protein
VDVIKSLFDIHGEWEKLPASTGLTERIRKAWNKPFNDLTNKELAALLLQKFAIEYILPIARQRIMEDHDDNSETYKGELEEAVNQFDLEDNL